MVLVQFVICLSSVGNAPSLVALSLTLEGDDRTRYLLYLHHFPSVQHRPHLITTPSIFAGSLCALLRVYDPWLPRWPTQQSAPVHLHRLRAATSMLRPKRSKINLDPVYVTYSIDLALCDLSRRAQQRANVVQRSGDVIQQLMLPHCGDHHLSFQRCLT